MRQFMLFLLMIFPLAAGSASRVEIDVFDRMTGQILPILTHAGQQYVAGEPSHRYELRIRNRSAQRLLAVTSVDGVNVVSGETAATSQRGYVIDGWSSVQIEGWRKSLEAVAAFYFTTLPDSYAARTGRPDDVGVVGVAVFRELERRPCCDYPEDRPHAGAAPSAVESDAAAASKRESARLGTGHGEHESSPARYVDFRRASTTPEQAIAIYYDSRRNLIAQGVLPARTQVVKQTPDPFPADFVADPPLR